jgi:hypothetical protein
MMRAAAILFCLLAVLGATPARAEATPIGAVTAVSGAATVSRTGQDAPATVAPGNPVFANDHVKTEKDARLAIRFVDGTELQMGGGGSLAIDSYVYDPKKPAENKAHFSILKTAFRYVSGKISKTPDPDVRIDLDLGAIGIRGTRLVRAMRDGQCWIYLEEGHITVSNGGGNVTLAPRQMTRLSSKTTAPLAPAAWSEDDIAWARREIGQ